MSAPCVAETGEGADEAAHFQLHQGGGDDVGGQAAVLDDAVHGGFFRGDGGKDGGFFGRELGESGGRFCGAGCAGEGEVSEVV